MESASATDAAADALAKTEIAATTEPADAISPEAAARKGALDAWSVTLAEHDAAWAALQTEKKLGWESAAVDWHWKKRDAQFGHGGHSKVDRVNNRGMVPSTSKYVRFYREWMPKNHPTLFGGGDKSSSGDARAGADRKFADVGSSPGGMCEYLVGDLGWSGYAFSLAPEAAGFGMSFTSPRLGYADSDATAPREWQRMLELVGGPGSLDFVNGGVVIDRGQQKQEPSALSDVHVLEHVEIYKNEILLGLHALKAGGALYFAYQLGQTALLFRILLALRPAFGSVRVTPTSPSAARQCTSFSPTSRAASRRRRRRPPPSSRRTRRATGAGRRGTCPSGRRRWRRSTPRCASRSSSCGARRPRTSRSSGSTPSATTKRRAARRAPTPHWPPRRARTRGMGGARAATAAAAATAAVAATAATAASANRATAASALRVTAASATRASAAAAAVAAVAAGGGAAAGDDGGGGGAPPPAVDDDGFTEVARKPRGGGRGRGGGGGKGGFDRSAPRAW